MGRVGPAARCIAHEARLHTELEMEFPQLQLPRRSEPRRLLRSVEAAAPSFIFLGSRFVAPCRHCRSGRSIWSPKLSSSLKKKWADLQRPKASAERSRL